MDWDLINRLVELMKEQGLVELEVEDQGQKVRLRKPDPNGVSIPTIAVSAPVQMNPTQARPKSSWTGSTGFAAACSQHRPASAILPGPCWAGIFQVT